MDLKRFACRAPLEVCQSTNWNCQRSISPSLACKNVAQFRSPRAVSCHTGDIRRSRRPLFSIFYSFFSNLPDPLSTHFYAMKRKPEPATAGDEDPETGEVIVGTEHSASISESPEDKPERRKKWRRSSSDFHNDCTSKYLGSVLDVIIEAKKGEMLSIVAGKHDDNGEVWKECEKLGFKYRAFYTEGKLWENPVTQYKC